jgi:hypothetical protein
MGANYLFLAPRFPQNSKRVSDFKPTLAGTFIWALYGFDKDLNSGAGIIANLEPLQKVRSKLNKLI